MAGDGVRGISEFHDGSCLRRELDVESHDAQV